MVEVAWRFAKEQKPHILNCWILPGCVHDIVLGSHFLNATKTLTTFKNRIRSKLVDLPRRLRLRLLGEEKQRLWGYLDGHLTAALPDTGSDVMFISSTYARNIGLLIDRDFEELLEVEFADGTTAWTSGVIRDVPWEVGGTTVRCDFHVLDALCVDVVLSKNYLFDLNVFSESSEYFFSVDSEDDLFQLFNIRLIGRYGATLNILEEEYLQDMASPDAFGPESVQRELARRDQIRDEILALDENKRKAATQAEAERQRRWEDLRQAHQTRWITASSAGLPPEELSGNDLQGATTRSGFWKKKAGDAVQSLVDQLLTGLSNEGAVLGQTYNQLRDLASNFSSLSVGDVLKRLAVILADGVLPSAQVVVDALLDVLQRVAESAIDLLHTKMHIPIISDILNAIGVPDISFLDLFTWIAAVGYTVVYKIANDEAPFPDTSEVSAIISASTWDDLSSLFHPKSAKKVNSIVRRAPVSASITLPEAMQSALFIASHATAGFMLFVGDIMGSLEAEVITGENPFSIPSAVLGGIVAAFEGGGNALVPKAPIDNTAVSVISDVTTAAVIVSKIVFSGPVQSRLGASGSKFPGLAVDDGRATGAIVNSVLIFPALFVTGWHFYELSAKPEGAERSAAIVGEMSNLTSYISRVSYAVAVNDMDPTTRQIPIGVMAVSNLVDAGLQTAEAIIH
ncbi:hypothetical protein ATEIFO6365_0003017800 [Aspergillus terreus]|uniref:Uncharacterized protein n=1 Tax=Aspergillus terreus TaxID=33178 RepID=A0A5M3YRC5_ASPTE|nr:hypothetical protein ATETN484_0003011700 [Aspergillus terreus]GFF14125.1 hypothetical protein ATEIFO6365_0003017800 [Aspergillus terreus]